MRRPGTAFTVEAEAGGLYRVTMFRDGRMVNRRRDVTQERIEEIKDALAAEVDE